jgi:hypothetical protein
VPSEQELRRAEEILELQEKYVSDKMTRFEGEIAKLKRKRRRRILQRSVALFAGVVLVLFGFIDLIVVQSLDANFTNILVFTLSELIAIPCLRYGIVLFRTMPVEQELSAVAEQMIHTQDDIAQLRGERLKLIRTPVKSTRVNLTPLQTDEPLITFQEPPTGERSESCPECGQPIRPGMKICRTCGHLFV